MGRGLMGVGLLACAALALACCGRPAGQTGAASGQRGAAADQGPGAPATASGGGLADGTYDCGASGHAMGKVDIQGATFRYRALDAPGGTFAPYSVDAGGQIHWGGPFPGIDEPPAHLTTSTRESFGFNVKFQVNPGSYEDTMSCHAPGR